MKAMIVNEQCRPVVDPYEADPRCGVDFCDACGDCLYCFASDECGQYGDEGHTWVVYADQADEFRASHPRTVTNEDQPSESLPAGALSQ